MTVPRTVDFMNGLLSLIKYGLINFLGRFVGTNIDLSSCQHFGVANDNEVDTLTAILPFGSLILI
jgi:hypothetical protein